MKTILRGLCFALGLALLLYIANTFFVQTDTLSYLTLHELTTRDDIDLAFVGSSVARNHFEPTIITEQTGLTAFNLALPYMSMQGSIAAAKLMFAHHSPEWTVLVAEPYLFTAERESPQTQFRLMPFIKNPIDRLSYYIDTSSQDDRWIDRLLMPRLFGVESAEQLIKTLHIHMDPEHYRQLQREQAVNVDIGSTYQGSGYMHPGGNIPEADRLRIAPYQAKANAVPGLSAYSQHALQRLERLCEKNGSKLMVIIFPYITASMLAEPDYLAYNQHLKAYCASRGIPCFDFTFARESLMPSLDPYFQNVEHMGIDGTLALSRAFCEVFTRYTAGEDVSDLFYPDTAAYLASIDRVTNVWFDKQTEEGVYTAACHHGTQVSPEYRFAAVAADGQETTLRDYAADNSWQGSVPDGHVLRVYARAQHCAQPPVYFDQL